MKPINCLIIDDEPKAIRLLESYAEHFTSLKVQATFRNGLKALEFLASNSIDAVFLDINMPHINGTQLAKLLPQHCKIIFTTAYSEYAVESYELKAFDYLLKPISFERFSQCIHKALGTNFPLEKATTTIKNLIPTTLNIKSGSVVYRIETSTILYLEKDGNYIKYYTEDKKVLARESITEALEKLPDNFLQCHKSYLVNCLKVTQIDKHELSIKDIQIPVSQSYRKVIQTYFGVD